MEESLSLRNNTDVMESEFNPINIPHVKGRLSHLDGIDLFFGKEVAINRNVTREILVGKLLTVGVPYRLSENRIILSRTNGLHIRVNLREYAVMSGDVGIIPQDSLLEIIDIPDDFQGQMITFVSTFCSLPFVSSGEAVLIHTDEVALRTTESLFSAIWNLSSSQPFPRESLRLCVSSLAEFLIQSASLGSVGPSSRKATRSETLFNGFLELVTLHYSEHRDVAFYADALCVSPHYLHRCVGLSSGRSVKEWINLAVTQQARYLLHYTDLPVSEIAARLNFDSHPFFTRFFKAETGQTPQQYRAAGQQIR